MVNFQQVIDVIPPPDEVRRKLAEVARQGRELAGQRKRLRQQLRLSQKEYEASANRDCLGIGAREGVRES